MYAALSADAAFATFAPVAPRFAWAGALPASEWDLPSPGSIWLASELLVPFLAHLSDQPQDTVRCPVREGRALLRAARALYNEDEAHEAIATVLDQAERVISWYSRGGGQYAIELAYVKRIHNAAIQAMIAYFA